MVLSKAIVDIFLAESQINYVIMVKLVLTMYQGILFLRPQTQKAFVNCFGDHQCKKPKTISVFIADPKRTLKTFKCKNNHFSINIII